jgi:hypothetical protein
MVPKESLWTASRKEMSCVSTSFEGLFFLHNCPLMNIFVFAVILWLYKEEECHLTNNIPSLVIEVMVVTLRMSNKSSLMPGMTTKTHLTYSAVISANDLSPAYFKIKIDARSSNEIRRSSGI